MYSINTLHIHIISNIQYIYHRYIHSRCRYPHASLTDQFSIGSARSSAYTSMDATLLWQDYAVFVGFIVITVGIGCYHGFSSRKQTSAKLATHV